MRSSSCSRVKGWPSYVLSENSGAGCPASIAIALPAKAELADQRAVPLQVLPLEVVEEAAAAANEHQQATARMVIVLVRAQMLGEVVDAAREHRDLDLGGPGVGPVLAEAGDELALFLCSQGHMRRGRVAGAPSIRLRPARFAWYSASSARRSSSSGSSPSQLAQPTLTVTASSTPS